jgi:hypothetical protein
LRPSDVELIFGKQEAARKALDLLQLARPKGLSIRRILTLLYQKRPKRHLNCCKAKSIDENLPDLEDNLWEAGSRRRGYVETYVDVHL